MTPLEIVKADHKKNNSQFSEEEVIAAFHNAENNPNVRILPYRNTLLIINIVTGDFHFVNAARFNDFVTNVDYLFNELIAWGIYEIHTTFTNPRILDVAKLTIGEKVIEKENNLYNMTVRL